MVYGWYDNGIAYRFFEGAIAQIFGSKDNNRIVVREWNINGNINGNERIKHW